MSRNGEQRPGMALSTDAVWALREQAAEAGDCETSRLCSLALWGTNAEKAQAKRKLAKAVRS